MNKRLWIILGATSIIAKEFAHIAAEHNHSLLLVGRNKRKLHILADDIVLRFHISCDVMEIDLSDDISLLLHFIKNQKQELDVFIGQSDIHLNDELTRSTIKKMLQTNVVNICLIIHSYHQRKQKQKHLLFLSSVASQRGRLKNSLYGGSKAAIEIYLQGLQQKSNPKQHIAIARLGFIDTHQTYGLPGIFYAAHPKKCAKVCWNYVHKNKRLFYFPKFWWLVMAILKHLPFFIYKKIGGV